MGMDARAQIWVGHKFEDVCGLEVINLPPQLEFLLDEYGQLLYGNKLQEASGGLPIEEFVESDNVVGFGIEILNVYWGDVEQLDFNSLAKQATELQKQLSDFFEKHNVDLPIGCYISVDYS